MSTKEKSYGLRQKLTNSKFGRNSGRKLKTKMVVSKALLLSPVRKSPEISVNAKHSFEFSSLKIKTLTDTLGSTQHKTQQSKETFTYSQDAGPYLINEEGKDKEGSLKNVPAGRKEKEICDVKQSVLRTVSRMLQENRIIREQWIRLSQIQRCRK